MAALWVNTPLDSRDAKIVYARIILGSARRYRRIRRRILGAQVPEWAKDLSGLLGPVKLIDLIPTYYSIMVIPKHFFRRLQGNGKRTGAIGLSPVNLLLQTAAIAAGVVACVVSLGPDLDIQDLSILKSNVDRNLFFVILLAIALLSPIWLPIVGILLSGLGYILDDGSPSLNGNHPFWFLRVFFPYGAVRTCTQRLFFGRLDLNKYFWGSFYISVAAVTIGVAFAIVSIILLAIGVAGELGGRFGHNVIHDEIYLLVIFLSASWLLKRFLCAYGAMMDSVCKYPRGQFYRKHVRKILRIKQQLMARRLSARKRERLRRSLQVSIDDLLEDSRDIEAKLRRNRALLEASLRERSSELVALESVLSGLDDPEDRRIASALMVLTCPQPDMQHS